MNSSSDIGPATREEPGGAELPPDQLPPSNWREAIMALIASRVTLIQLESKDAISGGARRAVFIAAAAGCALFTWALLLAGGISWIAEASAWPWSRVALATAGIHLLAGIVLARLAMKPYGNAAFPVTRAEFQKDREWIENFQKTKKSNG